MGKCMPSKSFKTTKCKIIHLHFPDFFKQSLTKIMGKNCVSTPFLPLTMLRNNEQILRQAMLRDHNIVYGERGDF